MLQEPVMEKPDGHAVTRHGGRVEGARARSSRARGGLLSRMVKNSI
jgi:hypothetical protein